MTLKQFNKIFFALLITHLVLLYVEPGSMLVSITKPTLLISLIAFAIRNGFKRLNYPEQLFVFGLVFSLLGDVLLINSGLFIFGLGAFLLAQLTYMFAFYRFLQGTKGLIIKKPLLAAPVIIFAGVIINILTPKVGELFPAIVLYTAVISLMLISAINGFQAHEKNNANKIVFGAILFVASDTILAFNKFYAEFTIAGVLIMLTYGLAQYLLTTGFLNLK